MRLINGLIWLLRSTARRLECWQRRLDGEMKPLQSHDEQVKRTSATYDMMTQPDELYYAQQYLRWIIADLSTRFPERDTQIVDIGCGQGRLSIPLAKWARDGYVIGVDFTLEAVKKARQYAAERRVTNCEFHHADALSFTQSIPSESMDVAVMLEVSFWLRTHPDVLAELHRILRPGASIYVTFRSQYFNLLHSIRLKRWDSAEMAIKLREGYLWGKPVWFSWHTQKEIEALLEEIGFVDSHCRGIGVCSGIEGDPLAAIARPSALSASEQERLMKIESAVAEQYAACGRYILATAVKPASPKAAE